MSRERVYTQCVDILRRLEKARTSRIESLKSNGGKEVSTVTRPWTAPEFDDLLQRRYRAHCAKKRKSGDDNCELSLHDFVVRSAIFKQPDFVFKNVMLSFQLMLDYEQGNSVVYEDKFVKWAPRLSPLTSKNSVKRLFLALSRKEKAKRSATNVTGASPRGPAGMLGSLKDRYAARRAAKSSGQPGSSEQPESEQESVRCVHFDQYCAFVKALEKQVNLERKGGDAFELRSTAGVSEVITTPERVIDYQRGAVDISGIPPRPGLIAVTDVRLIFHGRALSKVTNSCLLSEMTKVEKSRGGGLMRRDTLMIETLHGQQWHFNFVGSSKTSRDRLYETLTTMRIAYGLLSTVFGERKEQQSQPNSVEERIRRLVICEAMEDVMRDNALHVAVGSLSSGDARPAGEEQSGLLPELFAVFSSSDDDVSSKSPTLSFFRHHTREELLQYVEKLRKDLQSLDQAQQKAEQERRKQAESRKKQSGEADSGSASSWMGALWSGTGSKKTEPVKEVTSDAPSGGVSKSSVIYPVMRSEGASSDSTRSLPSVSENPAGNPDSSSMPSLVSHSKEFITTKHASEVSSVETMDSPMDDENGGSNEMDFIEEALLGDGSEMDLIAFAKLESETNKRRLWLEQKEREEFILKATAPTEKYEEFNPKQFIRYVKVIKKEFEPLQFVVELFKSTLAWTNIRFSLTIFVIISLIIIIGWLKYIPAILLALNALFLGCMKTDVKWTVTMLDKLLYHASHDEDFDLPYIPDWKKRDKQLKKDALRKAKLEMEAQHGNAFGGGIIDITSQMSSKESSSNSHLLFAKVKQYKDKFTKAYFELGEIQGSLNKTTIDLGRVRSIYLWKNRLASSMIQTASIIAALLLVFIPLWIVILVAHCGIFWKQCPLNPGRGQKGKVGRFVDSIEPDIPEVDDKEAGSHEDSHNGGDQQISQTKSNESDVLENEGSTDGSVIAGSEQSSEAGFPGAPPLPDLTLPPKPGFRDKLRQRRERKKQSKVGTS